MSKKNPYGREGTENTYTHKVNYAVYNEGAMKTKNSYGSMTADFLY
jgi:hypothetical protein